MMEMIKAKYCDLKIDDEFKLNNTKDLRVYKKTNDGALEIIDSFGYPCKEQNHRAYPYLTMPVYIIKE